MELMFQGLLQAMHWQNLIAMIFGVVVGMVFGAIPGLTAAAAMTILLPLTFIFKAEMGVLFLLAIWNAGVYAGSIPAIVLNIPGTGASAATTLDGYALSKKGMAKEALRASVTGSTIGAFVSGLALLFLSPPLARLSLMFGPAETFAFALFGLSIIVSLSSDSLINGLISGFLGLLIATVGFAPSGALRFVYTPELIDGFPVIIVLIGLFTIPEVMDLIERQRLTITKNSCVDVVSKRSNFLLKISDWKSFSFNFLRSSGIGSFVGILPGAGPTIAGFVSYNEARRASKNPAAFGKGEIDGVIAADTANNAAVLSSLVPALTLGIPGSVDAVIILAALTMHGLLPGPMLFERNADLVYAVFMGVFVANFIMLIVGSISARHIAKITRVRVSILSPIILVFAIVGAFAVRNNWFDVFLAIIIGLIGYGLKRMNIPLAPLVLGAILGPILERNLYQMVVSYSGRINELVTRPIFIVFILLSILSILMPILRSKRG
jgi:putative tricarboxylic transport membrane protein